MNDPVIKVRGLGKRYRVPAPTTSSARGPFRRLLDTLGMSSSRETLWALKDVSFEVQRGEVLGIIGRNGAGKSTLLKILSRITEPTEGRAELHGRVGSLLEVGTGFHPDLTGRENVFLNGAILGMQRAEIARKFDEIVSFAEVERFIDTPVKYYSSGMYVRLAFAVAAHLETEILLVDEVLAVGDIHFRQKCMGKMENVSRSGRTILFVSHDMSSVRQLCQNVLWCEGGRIRNRGTADAMTTAYEEEAFQLAVESSGRFERAPKPDKGFYVEWVELRDAHGNLQTRYRYGDVMTVLIGFHGTAPQDGFTVEWLLLNERGQRISFGAANPVSNVYFNRGDRTVACRIGPMPLTMGAYRFYFSPRVWGQARWDEWDSPVRFHITRCDPFGTGHDVPAGPNGDFVMPQTWSVVRKS